MPRIPQQYRQHFNPEWRSVSSALPFWLLWKWHWSPSTVWMLNVFSITLASCACGGCKPGLSLTLGSSHCQYCSDQYLALLAAFAAAGVVPVIFLIASNTTVTEGTVNWLIFYANIFRMNRAIFFPPQTFNILSIFITWINLDLGIELLLQWHGCICNDVAAVCISTLHLDNYDICHCSQPKIPHCCKTIIGKNAVKVLATLFLLSYTKLLHTIITVFSFTDITWQLQEVCVAVWWQCWLP